METLQRYVRDLGSPQTMVHSDFIILVTNLPNLDEILSKVSCEIVNSVRHFISTF